MTRYGILSTYPPTRCGLATFALALQTALTASRIDQVSIVRSLDSPDERTAPDGMPQRSPDAELLPHDPVSMRRAVAVLDACDVAIVQHEYGIYGGPDGEEVVAVLRQLRTPAIVVLHTVLPSPSAHQRAVLEAVCEHAASVVVMTLLARDTLLAVNHVDPRKVVVIPHGVASLGDPGAASERPARRRILTWGLISRGKGLEWGIRAVNLLRDLDVEYVIAGQTHPKVRAAEGEEYRRHLESVIHDLGAQGFIRLDDRYLSNRDLERLVATADVVLLPYESSEQATSGVLAEAVAAGLPVVSTRFPHSVELLSGGAGLLAAHADPRSMAAALREILESDATAQRERAAAARRTAPATWPVVADEYRSLAASIMAERAA